MRDPIDSAPAKCTDAHRESGLDSYGKSRRSTRTIEPGNRLRRLKGVVCSFFRPDRTVPIVKNRMHVRKVVMHHLRVSGGTVSDHPDYIAPKPRVILNQVAAVRSTFQIEDL